MLYTLILVLAIGISFLDYCNCPIMPLYHLILFNSFTNENGLMGPCSLYLPLFITLQWLGSRTKGKLTGSCSQPTSCRYLLLLQLLLFFLAPYKHKEFSHLKDVLFPLPRILFPQSSPSCSHPSSLQLNTTSSERHPCPLL